ncbi:MAG: Na+:solute symporter [Bacteroidales bacterium]|nr:Na+:solute symporter [Bacteroidales bacterium]
MKLTFYDLLIILLYIISIVFIGFYLKKRAQKNKSSYLLGENKLPWYMLGLSNASGMFDISGTMWLVTITFVYGLKSIWIPWLWPVFNQIFLMVYLSVWLRRSNVTTGAEWILTRFGNGKDGRLSHNIVVIYAIIGCLGFLAYGFVGLGKFVEIFIPWEFVCGILNIDPAFIPAAYIPHIYGTFFTLIATLYAILGGMVSIVWADVIQYSIMTISAIVIAIIAMVTLSSQNLIVPDGWMSPFFGIRLNMDWGNIIREVNDVISKDGYSLFSIFFMMMLFKGILVSAAGPAPNYDMQKILATRSPREAAKMSGSVSVILMPFRYLLIAGFVILAILYYDKLDLLVGGKIDFEQILPSAMSEFVPAGFLGLLLAGLTAAFMSTFAGTLNAAQAYLVNDLYLKYVRPETKGKKLSMVNYLTGITIVLISIFIGISIKNIDSILKWIVNALWASYIASNVLKWYWWRFNGKGYFWGMVAGLVPAIIFARFVPDKYMLYLFPVILLISLTGSLLGTFLSPATDEKTLIDFYKSVRPWGFWKPIHERIAGLYPGFKKNTSFRRDMFNILTGIIWQTALVALPIYIVLLKHTYWIITAIIVLICSLILKKTWWDRLSN